jgi:hypothetical protein
MIEYTWNFPILQTKVSDNGLNDVVYRVQWYYKGIDTETRKMYECFGLHDLPSPVSGSEEFVPFTSLTKEIVQGWIENSFGSASISEMQTGIAQRIDEQNHPVIEFKSAPWI